MDASAQAELVRRCCRGEAAAWDELISGLYPEVARFVFLINPAYSLADVNEVVSGAFADAVKSIGVFGGRNPARVGLLYAAMRKAANLRPRPDRAPQGAAPQGGAGTPGEAAGTPSHQELFQALDRLGGPCRDLVVLRYFGGLELADLAPEFEVSEATLGIRIGKCLGTLAGLVSLGSAAGSRKPGSEGETPVAADSITVAITRYREWRLRQLAPDLQPPESLRARVREALLRLPQARPASESPWPERRLNPEALAKVVGATAGVLTVAAGIVLVASRSARDTGPGPEPARGGRATGAGIGEMFPPGEAASLNRGTERELDEFLSRVLPVNPPTDRQPVTAGAPADAAGKAPPQLGTVSAGTGERSDAPGSSEAVGATVALAANPAPTASAPAQDAGSSESGSAPKSASAAATPPRSPNAAEPPWAAEQALQRAPAWVSPGLGPVARAVMQVQTFAHYGASPLVEKYPATAGRPLNAPVVPDPTRRPETLLASASATAPTVPPSAPAVEPAKGAQETEAIPAKPEIVVAAAEAPTAGEVAQTAPPESATGIERAVAAESSVADTSSRTDWTVEVVAAVPTAADSELGPADAAEARSRTPEAPVAAVAAEEEPSAVVRSRSVAVGTPERREDALPVTEGSGAQVPVSGQLADVTVTDAVSPAARAGSDAPASAGGSREVVAEANTDLVAAKPTGPVEASEPAAGLTEVATAALVSPSVTPQVAGAGSRPGPEEASKATVTDVTPETAAVAPGGQETKRPLIGLNLNLRIHLGGKSLGTVGINTSPPAEGTAAVEAAPPSSEGGEAVEASAAAPVEIRVVSQPSRPAGYRDRRVTPLAPLREQAPAVRQEVPPPAYRSTARPDEGSDAALLRVARVTPAIGTTTDFSATEFDAGRLPAPGPGTPAGLGESAKFVREETARGLRRNLNSPPLPPVLQEFCFAERAGQLVLRDSDGSEYRIQLMPGDGPFPSLVSLASALQQSRQPLAFSATGLSRAAGEMVTFEGWLEAQEVSGSVATLAADAEAGNALAATEVRGEVQLGSRQRFPVTARSGRD
jgi:DNA-directed RNA polymerase specialized sigma24 family protein